MSDDLKTFREVTGAMGNVQKQFSWHTNVFAASVAIAVTGAGFFYNKLANVSETAVKIETMQHNMVEANLRIETKLANIEATLLEIRTNTKKTVGDLGDIKDAIKIASAPKPDAFQGFLGAKIDKSENLKAYLSAIPDKANVWIYSDDTAFIKAPTGK